MTQKRNPRLSPGAHRNVAVSANDSTALPEPPLREARSEPRRAAALGRKKRTVRFEGVERTEPVPSDRLVPLRESEIASMMRPLVGDAAAPKMAAKLAELTVEKTGKAGVADPRARAAGPSLDTDTKLLLVSDRKRAETDFEEAARRAENRRDTFDGLRAVRRITASARQRTCMAHSTSPLGTVDINRILADGGGRASAHFMRVTQCGSVWTCPVCANKKMEEQRQLLRMLIVYAALQGWTIAFQTMTLRHKAKDPLKNTLAVLSECASAIRRSGRVKRARDDIEEMGFVRLLEVTHGGNGWHPHLHYLRIFEGLTPTPQVESEATKEVEAGLITREEAEERVTVHHRRNQARLNALLNVEFDQWALTSERLGQGEPLRERADIKEITSVEDMAKYLTKHEYTYDGRAAAAEMTSKRKTGRNGGRAPFEILRDIANGEPGTARHARDVELFRTFEAAIKGKATLRWSDGLKDLVLAAKDELEAHLVDDQPEDISRHCTDEGVIGSVWAADMQRHGPAMLNAAQFGGREALRLACAELGVEYLDPESPLVVRDRKLSALQLKVFGREISRDAYDFEVEEARKDFAADLARRPEGQPLLEWRCRECTTWHEQHGVCPTCALETMDGVLARVCKVGVDAYRTFGEYARKLRAAQGLVAKLLSDLATVQRGEDPASQGQSRSFKFPPPSDEQIRVMQAEAEAQRLAYRAQHEPAAEARLRAAQDDLAVLATRAPEGYDLAA